MNIGYTDRTKMRRITCKPASNGQLLHPSAGEPSRKKGQRPGLDQGSVPIGTTRQNGKGMRGPGIRNASETAVECTWMKKGQRVSAPKTTAWVCEDTDGGGGERETRGRNGPISPQNGGAHAGVPERADGNRATSNGAGPEGPNPLRGCGRKRTIETRICRTENDC